MIAISNVFLAISGNDLSNLQLFSQFSAAAYCPNNNIDKAGGTKLTCSVGNCPLVQDSDVVSVYEFQKYVLKPRRLILTPESVAGSYKMGD